MHVPITNPTFQPSLQEVTPVQDADLLNDSREQHHNAITFAENLMVPPISEKKIQPLGDVVVEPHAEGVGETPEFNPCKLLHMNYAFKV
ncbi:MAG: hypothetical protein ACOYK6_03665 [Chthoniobacterales bacterium]